MSLGIFRRLRIENRFLLFWMALARVLASLSEIGLPVSQEQRHTN